MPETVKITALQANISTHDHDIRIKAEMTINQMADAVRSIAAVMPGPEWNELMAEINREE